MSYTAINIQGNILSLEILDKIRADEEFAYQKPQDFGFGRKESLRDHIGAAWAEAHTLWEMYRRKVENLPEGEYGTSPTRKLWMVPLLYELGYDLESARAEEVEGRTYPISHRDIGRDGFPVLIMGYEDALDRKPGGNRLRMSPHALMQEYLNRTEHLYGLVTNGRVIRLLRDSNRLARLAYIEFDIEKMIEEDLYNEFALMYRLIHASRMPASQEETEESVIEHYHQESLAAGTRIRNKLRMAVKEAMEHLGNGFLQHAANEDFIARVRAGEVQANVLYRLLLRVIYRIIFVATIEERNLVFGRLSHKDPDYERKHRLRTLYREYYSFERLRGLAAASVYIDPAKEDLWQALLTTFRLFEPLGEGEKLGIQPLGGDLFGAGRLQEEGIDLYGLHITNEVFLGVLDRLTVFRNEKGERVRVNYRDLDVEELGSVYEALLELHPYFSTGGVHPRFGFTEGSERKLTGSYYTRHDLVAQLIRTALLPVIEERVGQAATPAGREQALLEITVCDPAAGSGHFLLAAARTLGFELARIRSGEENPGEEWITGAMRDVVERCIYGVDKNPAAVELCRLGLWLVGHNSGKPLTFLDHKIKCGDSLVGLDDLQRLDKGIPNGAFKPVTGDDKATAAYFAKKNKNFLKDRQLSLVQEPQETAENIHRYAGKYRDLVRFKVETLADYEEKQREYQQIKYNPGWLKDQTACNLFTWAFFQPYRQGQQDHETVTSETLALFRRSSGSVNARLEGIANAAAAEHRFFHWPLEFPDVFERGGFDVMLGNPPWDIIELKEKEFFATRDVSIANAANKAQRIKKIEKLKENNPALYEAYVKELHYINASRRFIQESGVLTLTIKGRTNTYSVFSELALKKLNKKGRGGILVPTGIATDDSNKLFFSKIVENNQLVSLFDFENKKALFPDVHRSYKFCLLNISGGEVTNTHKMQFAFFLHDVLDLQDKRRVFTLTKDDFLRINPNTRTTPVFRTKIDAELTSKIYSRVPVLINEQKNQNPWGITFRQGLFNMSSDSHLFRTAEQLRGEGFVLQGNRFVRGEEMWLPLYESKMIWHFDHRFCTYAGVESRSSTHMPTPTPEQYRDPAFLALPWYWVSREKVEEQTDREWFLGFRDIARSTDNRTGIFTIIPYVAINNKLPVMLSENSTTDIFCLLGHICPK